MQVRSFSVEPLLSAEALNRENSVAVFQWVCFLRFGILFF
jgi:hypothetical protein